ncbi:MAG: hypothetical protein CBC35_06690 [Planctomycetes bacterium TMED75]|nr:hypothetical protein [Planctomycetaceae bacterium]OUU92829.1 MAG: hypothetical protein CBC35_06690 [Planctomycetes bacterium TMED75]
MKVVGIIAAVLVLIGGCCIGTLFLGSYVVNSGLQTTIQPQVEGTPAVEKFVGKVDSISLSWNQTAQQAQSGDDNRLALDISGDKGSALLIVKMGDSGTPEKLKWAVLEADGSTYAVIGNPPKTLDAVNLDGTPAPTEEENPEATTGSEGAADTAGTPEEGAAGADGANAAGAAGSAGQDAPPPSEG